MLKVAPLRRGCRGGWLVTDEHKAQTWAVVNVGKGQHLEIILRRKTKAEAEELLAATLRAAKKANRSYTLGARMDKKPASVGTVVSGRNPRYAPR